MPVNTRSWLTTLGLALSLSLGAWAPASHALTPQDAHALAAGDNDARIDTLKLRRDALKHRINTAPGSLFSVKDRYRHCLRISCSLPWSEEIEAALRTLGELIKQQL